MGSVIEYRAALEAMDASGWETYLHKNSGLPGPRGNLELAWAVAEVAPARTLRRWSRTDDEYLAVCGTIGLGRLLANGDLKAESELHHIADENRWRVREAVAMALQRVGDNSRSQLIAVTRKWAGDPSLLVRRAAAAGLCEPRLLDTPVMKRGALAVLDRITRDMAKTPEPERRQPAFGTLRKAMGYCWSVAVAALPNEGFDRFERWVEANDRDVLWVVRENLKKARMQKADPGRTKALADRLAS